MQYVIFLLVFLLASCDFPGISSTAVTQSGDLSTSQSGSYQTTLDPETKLTLAKKRKSYMSGIRKGDFYSLKNAPEEALSYYLSVQEKLPDDQVVTKKIAHVYFLLKDWGNAYSSYVQVPFTELTSWERDELFRSLFFRDGVVDRLSEISRFPEDPSRPYYQTVDACYTGIHNCIVTIEAYSGSDSRIGDLQTQIKNAQKISGDYQYRNLLVAAKLYEQSMYRASERISQEILSIRSDYNEALKIQAFSQFELGEYDRSRKSLLAYLEKSPNDLESLVRMGEIQYHLADYAGSNLYLNNAIAAGYTPKIDLERRLMYNYSLLGDTAGSMKVMNYLLQEADVTEDDFAVGISLALEQGDNAHAKSWAMEGLSKFKNSPLLEPLYIQVLRTIGDRDGASSLIQNASQEMIVQNPNYLLEKAILLFDAGNTQEAKDIFTTLTELENWPDIVAEATAHLDQIRTQETTTASGTSQKWW